MAELSPIDSVPVSDEGVLQWLTQRIRQIEGTRWKHSEVVSSGLEPLDGLLPEGGFQRGTLVEWVGVRDGRGRGGSGAGLLALGAARAALAAGGALVVIDRAGRFYPPAALSLGIALEQLILVRPASAADQDWVLDQVLRSRGVAVAWCVVEDASDHTFRRWQLAAETSGALGFLVRDGRALAEPSWAELRLGIEPLAMPATHPSRTRRLRVELLRSRVGPAGRAVELEFPASNTPHGTRGTHHETGALHLASSVASATARRGARRA